MLLDQPCLWNGNDGSDGKTGGKNGSCRVENGEMGIRSDKKGQNKIQIRERDCKNCKAGRQTSECKATLVWTRKKERKLCGEKDDGDDGARHKEKRKAKEKVDGFVGAREGDEVDRVK